MAAIEAHSSSRGGDDRGDATLRLGWSRRGSGGGVVAAGSRRGAMSLHKRQMCKGLRPRAVREVKKNKKRLLYFKITVDTQYIHIRQRFMSVTKLL